MRTLAIGLTVLILTATGAGAEPVTCQKQVIKNLLKFKKTYLKKIGKCAENQNLNKLDDDDECPDAATQLKLDATAAKIRLKIELSCPEPYRTTLGFPSS